MGFWEGRRTLVTGGASFIGSHLVEALVHAGASVRIADDFSSGRLENLAACEDSVEVLRGDLRNPEFAVTACTDREMVFHLAADHGGRGYVDLHQWNCATNLALDQSVFAACLQAGVDKVTFASSGCVYPNHLQTQQDEELFLTEDMVGPPYDPDGMYGLAKLTGELSLQALQREHGLASASCRFFTVYGPRGVENHAVIAMIARAFIAERPFGVWGTGEQIRNWTYVHDIVSGTMLAAERLHDGSPVNLGTMERTRVIEAVKQVLQYTGHDAEVELQPLMPTGPINRVADNSRARRLLGWQPEMDFATGLVSTIDWYYATKEPEQVREILGVLLTERPAVLTPR